ncbi:MAG: hypothetical protein GEV05_07940 [Betaproteobacteria bacterium]|nr:hypothetical protein [Betaproteobacteria bacterium]
MNVESTLRVINEADYPGAPGIAGAHEWEVKEGLELIDIRATTETNRKMQFTVDKATRRSYIDLEELAKREGIHFKSHY